VQREIQKMLASGLITVTLLGNQKHYQANANSPVFTDLNSLIEKTIGLAEPLREALTPVRGKIKLALVYGSIAKRQETASSDIDLLIVSDMLTLENCYKRLAAAEKKLSRKINVTLYTQVEFTTRKRIEGSFLSKVLAGKTIVLFGASNDD
jgi:predicted nucleotidyltransferase